MTGRKTDFGSKKCGLQQLLPRKLRIIQVNLLHNLNPLRLCNGIILVNKKWMKIIFEAKMLNGTIWMPIELNCSQFSIRMSVYGSDLGTTCLFHGIRTTICDMFSRGQNIQFVSIRQTRTDQKYYASHCDDRLNFCLFLIAIFSMYRELSKIVICRYLLLKQRTIY